jgi:multiple sugar transport system substrate-binding protein
MQDGLSTKLGMVLRGIAVACALVLLVWTFIPTPPQNSLAASANGGHRRIPVYYWHMWAAQWLPVMNHVVAEFNASQDKYEVIPLQVPAPPEGDQKFLLATAGGDPPDVMAQWTPAISAWAQAKCLSPLDTRMTPAERQYFLHSTYPTVHNNGWYKGHLYGMLVNFDVYACYYKPDQWRKAGLDPDHFPTTLPQLVADGKKLNQTDSQGHLTRLGFLPAVWTDYLPSFGGHLYDPATGQVTIETPQNLAAMQYIVQAHQQLGFDNIVRFNAGLGSEQGASWPFISDQQAIVLDGEWRVKQLAQYAPHLNYRVALLPPPVGGTPLASYTGTSYLTIPAGAKHAEGAWEFIKFWQGLDDPARAAPFNVSFGWLPNSPQMAASPAYQAYLRQFPEYRTFVKLAASPNIVSLPPVPDAVYIQDRIADDDDLAERGILSPNASLARLQKQVDQQERQRKELGYDQ